MSILNKVKDYPYGTVEKTPFYEVGVAVNPKDKVVRFLALGNEHTQEVRMHKDTFYRLANFVKRVFEEEAKDRLFRMCGACGLEVPESEMPAGQTDCPRCGREMQWGVIS